MGQYLRITMYTFLMLFSLINFLANIAGKCIKTAIRRYNLVKIMVVILFCAQVFYNSIVIYELMHTHVINVSKNFRQGA